MKKVLEVSNLSKSFKVKVTSGKVLKDLFKPDYRRVEAVKEVSFGIEKGESVAFLGPNGAGKTTTTKMMVGLLYPSSGEISLMGHTPFERKREMLMNIGLVMGNKAGLSWDLTPLQNFELYQQIYKIENNTYEKRLRDLSGMLDVRDVLDVQVRKLSLGQRMKVELIGSIIHQPKVLFLDEPTIGLDVISKAAVRDFLKNIQEIYDTTLILTSHDMDDVEKVCERVVIISDGEIIFDDELINLTSEYKGTKFIKVILEDPIEGKGKDLNGYEVVDYSDSSFTLKIEREQLSEAIEYITRNFEIHDIDIVSVPLEQLISDIFRNTSG
jgi:ABC-2 type transport system ATP-binding protein